MKNKPPGVRWADDFSLYVAAMTRGHGYGGEIYWDEEERILRDYFKDKQVKRTLSVGCGLFRELETLQHISIEVAGLEYEQMFIDYLRMEFEKKGISDVKLLNGDICQTPLAGENFDLITVHFNTLGVFRDIPVAIANMCAMLNEYGILWISVWMDTDVITQMRTKIYTSYGDKIANIEPDPVHDFNDIVVYKDGMAVHRSAIVPADYLRKILRSFPGCAFEIRDYHYSRVVIVRKL